MMAASIAGQRGLRVVLIDHAEKLAEKIRISGGGRCNFTNTGTSPENFLSKNPHFCRSALAGYTPRNGYQRLAPEVAYMFFPKSRRINRHGPGFTSETIWNEALGVTDELHTLIYMVQFNSFAEFTLNFNNQYTHLFFPFDPTRTGGEPLQEGTAYRNNFVSFEWKTDPRSAFALLATGQIGEYYNGNMRQFTGTTSWRIGYLANISMNFRKNLQHNRS